MDSVLGKSGSARRVFFFSVHHYMYIEYAQERVIKGNILLWMKTNLDFNWW